MRKQASAFERPGPGEGKRGQEGHLGYLLRQANVAFRARLERALQPARITQPQFTIMTMIDAYPGCSSAEVARLSLLTPQTITVVVANLNRDGLLRTSPHPVHGRIQQLHLTRRGEASLERCKGIVDELERSLVAGLSRDDEKVVRDWLVQVAVGERATRPALDVVADSEIRQPTTCHQAPSDAPKRRRTGSSSSGSGRRA